MATASGQAKLFGDDDVVGDTIVINDRCAVRTVDGLRVVLVAGVPLIHYDIDDRAAEAFAMVMIVEREWADQNDVARAFACSTRTVRRYQRRYEEGGMALLGREGGCPGGRPRAPGLDRRVGRLKGKGWSNCQIARQLGVTEKAVRKRLRRLGFEADRPEQLSLAGCDPPASSRDWKAEPKDDLPRPPPSGTAADPVVKEADPVPDPGSEGSDPNLSASADNSVEKARDSVSDPGSKDSDPNLSAFAGGLVESEPVEAPTIDTDPADRWGDRVMARLGLLQDAAPLFGNSTDVPGAGVLLAVPALVHSGVFSAAREVYGSIGPAFYGLRTSILVFLFMALLRIKRPEALKERSPAKLGRLLGLDRAPETKTVRRKLDRLAQRRAAAEFGRRLAERRVAVRGKALGFLYIDGHVRVYHGKRRIPKTHAARMHFVMPATTEYWVNDVQGDPLFVVNAEANDGLVKMLPEILGQTRELVGDRRLTVVFDRGGWSPRLFAQIIDERFDILTYRKGKFRRIPKRCFTEHESTIDGVKVRFLLDDRNAHFRYDKRKRLRLRQVTRLKPRDGKQTPVLTSRCDLPAIDVAFRMFSRWAQENFFGYMREEYLLDALVDYDVEPADPTRSVPNPERAKANAKLRKAHEELAQLGNRYGLEALSFIERKPFSSASSLKIANRKIATEIWKALEHVRDLERRRDRVPTRVPVSEVTKGPVIKLSTEGKHLSNLFKMVAYQAESDLFHALAPHYARSEDEGRTLVQTALSGAGDIAVTDTELRVTLAPLSSPHRTRAVAALCEQLNATNTVFPGTRLRLRYAVAEPAGAWA